MFKKLFLTAAVAITPFAALAAGGGGHIEDVDFPYEGPFGSYDQAQLQRGFQVFHEVCASCHGLKYVSFRSLGDHYGPGFPPEQVKGIAALYEVTDEEGEPGDTREGKPSDNFPDNVDAGAPDLSLMAKARAGFHGPGGLGINQLLHGTGGAEYIYTLMIGYEDAPECAADSDIEGYYNTAFTAGGYPDSCKDDHGHHTTGGSWISMPPPLEDNLVEYAAHGEAKDDGHGGHGAEYHPPAASIEQMSEDVSAFLMWSAEPKLVERKTAGLRNIIALIALAVLLYYTNRKLWAPVKRKDG